MDHLLRNRRLGSLATPVSNPFLCPSQFTFYTTLQQRNRQSPRLTSAMCGVEFFLDRGSESEQHQFGGVRTDRDGGAAIEVDLVPAVGNNVATVHVRSDGRLLIGPIHPRPRGFSTLFGGEVARQDEVVLCGAKAVGLLPELLEFTLSHGVSQPRALSKPGGEQQAAALLCGLFLATTKHVFAGGVLVSVGDEQVVHGGVGGESVARCRFDEGLKPGKFVDDGLASKHRFDIVLEGVDGGIHVEPVSYTHLTLPTT